MSDTAISAIVTIATMLIGFLSLWLKLRYGERRDQELKDDLRTNTSITRAGTTVAARNAAEAKASAAEAKAATEQMSNDLRVRLNGGIDAAINEAMGPMRQLVNEHAEKIETLTTYVHQRNHDILNELQKQSSKLEVILQQTKVDKR